MRLSQSFSLLLLAGGTPLLAEEDTRVSYNEQVRPILSGKCFACHGPDEEDQQGDIRLDIPGHVDLQVMLDRIHTEDPKAIMPPPGANKTLSAEEKEIIEKWVAQGANYEKHWAFVAPEPPAVPADVHPVDHFVDAALAAEGLEPAPQAHPHTRLRRVYLDLIGLPPTLGVAEAFAADPSQEAFEEIVDGLLDSPRYGERWARKWLDIARYADTNGYEKDRDRTIWPYRDWVIKAINDDLPFDEFTVHQLAGDMLPDATPQQIVATGFHRNTMLNEEGGIDPLEFRYHALVDRVGTTGTAWLGLTTSCAQCHTHKYDPITHHDYFGMMAYFNNADEPDYYIRTGETDKKEQANRAKAIELIESLPGQWAEKGGSGLTFDEALEKWASAEREKIAEWKALVPVGLEANGPYLTLEDDGVIIAGGDTSKHDIYHLEFPASDAAITSIQLEALTDARLPGTGPGTTYYEGPKGDFFLSEIQLKTVDGKTVKFASASESEFGNAFSNAKAMGRHAIDGDIQTGWSIGKATGRRQVAVFNLAEPLPAGTAFTVQMDFSRHYSSALGKFRLSATSQGNELKASALDPEVLALLAEPNAALDSRVREAFLLSSEVYKDEAEQIRQLRRPVLGTPTLVMAERPKDHQRDTFLHHRGEYTQPTEKVPARLPDAIYPADQAPPADRLEFAKWIVSRGNPLTARVVANRQ